MTTPTDKTKKLIEQMGETQAQAKEVLAASALGEAVLEILKSGQEPTRSAIGDTLQGMLNNPKTRQNKNSINLAQEALQLPKNT